MNNSEQIQKEKTTNSSINQQDSKDNKQSIRKRHFAMIILGAIFILIALIWLIYWLVWGQYKEYTDDAYVTGNMVQLMPQVPGTVIEIKTDDAQLVKEGQEILRIDPADYQIELQQAKANLAQTVRQVRQYYENAKVAQQNLILSNADLLKAELDLKRRLSLVGNRAVSKEEIQHYRTAFDAAKANYEMALHRLESAKAIVENSHLYDHPLVEAAKAKLKNAFLNYQRTTIRAPITGYIAKRNVQPGQQVSMSSALLAIIPLRGTWVDANYKESSLNHIRVNQPAVLYADAYPGITYHGRVVGLNAGTGSAFSLLPPQNATGNWIKIVQRLPVRIELDEQELQKNPLQLGLSIRITINTHNREGSRMPLNVNKKIDFQTDIYKKQLAEVNVLIDRILKSNSEDVTFPRVNAHG